MQNADLYVSLGLAGVAGVLFAYGMMTAGKWRADSARYQLTNVLGTTGILLSLLGQWNLPAFIANVAWICVGLYSLLRLYRKRRA